MNECYDCGELFSDSGECPQCGSENVGTVEREGSSFADEYYSEERFPDSFDEDEDDLSEDIADVFFEPDDEEDDDDD
jgi:predicted  nucleic acid-binding Zn-ribbon protein